MGLAGLLTEKCTFLIYYFVIMNCNTFIKTNGLVTANIIHSSRLISKPTSVQVEWLASLAT